MADEVPPSDVPATDWEAEGPPPVSPDEGEQHMLAETDNIVPSQAYRMLPVVALGGSAGCIPALQHFFSEMPPDSGMAFVVAMHLAAGHESIMDEIIGRSTTMPVEKISDGVQLEANTVYVIPPGSLVSAVDGQLKLT